MVQQLPAGRRAEFLFAVLEYGLNGKTFHFNGAAGILFETIKQSINCSLSKQKSYYRCKEKNSESETNRIQFGTESEPIRNRIGTKSEKEKENKKEVSPLSPSSRTKQENKETSSAHAHTDAHALKATADVEDFADLIPQHLAADPDFLREWGEWLEFRRKNRKKVSRMAASRQLHLLGEYQPADAIRIIETSITNDWQGLFPCKVNNIKPIRDYTGI